MEYTVDDGLKVLEYLGLTNITDREKEIFREQWSRVFARDGFISAVWKLYAEVLPFMCGDVDTGSFLVSQVRDADFGRRLELTGLGERLKNGVDLDDIVKEGHHSFYVRAPAEE